MDWYRDYKLVKEGDDYIVEIYLNIDMEEFSKEFSGKNKDNILKLDDKIKKLVSDKYSDVRIKAVKLLVGTVIVASIPFSPAAKVQAAETTTVTQSAFTALNTSGVVTASTLNVRTGPSTSYSVFHLLYRGNRVTVIGKQGDWYKIQLSNGKTGWVSSLYLQLDARQQKINTVISTAKSLIGTPYVWGGESPAEGGFDCSGFTQYCFKQAGYTLNRISADQATQGVYVPYANLQPGDLVFYTFTGGPINHVGIYLGNGQMIHSPKTGDTVRIVDITTSYWTSRYVTARRIIT